jgi:hypothetical protein
MAELTDKEVRNFRQRFPANAPAGKEFKVVNVGDWPRSMWCSWSNLSNAIDILRDARKAGHAAATIEMKASK